jgi:Nuclease-related domain
VPPLPQPPAPQPPAPQSTAPPPGAPPPSGPPPSGPPPSGPRSPGRRGAPAAASTVVSDTVLSGTVLPPRRRAAPADGTDGQTAGLVYEAPPSSPPPAAPAPARPGPTAEAEPAQPDEATQPDGPAQPDAPASNEGLGIFGGVTTTEVRDDEPARESSHRRPRRPRRAEPPVPGPGRPAPVGAEWNQPSAAPPAGSQTAEETRQPPFGLMRRLLGPGAPADDGHPRTNVRDLPPDVQLRLWRIRIIIMVVAGAVFGLLTKSWEVGLTVAILAGIIDSVYRSRNAANYVVNGAQPGGRAQKTTSRQLAKLRREGYLTIEGRHIPESPEIIDHLVIGPSGVFAIDSEKWDPKLPIRTINGKRLYLGPESQKDRLEHAIWEASQASEILSATLGTTIPVRPALGIYGPKIPWEMATIRSVDIYTGNQLRKYLKRRGRVKEGAIRLTGEQIRAIYDAADQQLPHTAGSKTNVAPVG